MPVGKEIERPLTPDEIALNEVQGYIDRVERQAETQQPQTTKPQQTQTIQKPSATYDDKGVFGATANVAKPKIVLPLNQTGVENGLRKGFVEGLRWLAEWCVMMIKKYPGRVFYLPPETKQ